MCAFVCVCEISVQHKEAVSAVADATKKSKYTAYMCATELYFRFKRPFILLSYVGTLFCLSWFRTTDLVTAAIRVCIVSFKYHRFN